MEGNLEGPPDVTDLYSALGVKVSTSGLNSRDDAESKMSYTRGFNSQRFRTCVFLKYSK